MEDRYLNFNSVFVRLVDEYREHKSLIVCFDFDNTVFDYHNRGDTFPVVEKLLIDCKNRNFTLVLFTCREDEELEKAIEYCEQRGFKPDYVNESPVYKSRKPYYNILLDDRAGLSSAVNALRKTIDTIDLIEPLYANLL